VVVVLVDDDEVGPVRQPPFEPPGDGDAGVSRTKDDDAHRSR